MTQDQGKAWNPGDPTPGEREAFSWGHGAGYEAGKAAVRAEIQAQWENVSRVFIAAEWAGKPTADARRLKRLATIQAAHEAGLHVASAPAGGPLYGGCPWCIGEGAPVIPGCYRCGHPVGMHTVAGCTQYGKTSYGSGPCPCDLRDDMLLAGVPHSRNYGAPDQSHWWCRTHGRPYGECAGNNTDGMPCAANRDHSVNACLEFDGELCPRCARLGA